MELGTTGGPGLRAPHPPAWPRAPAAGVAARGTGGGAGRRAAGRAGLGPRPAHVVPSKVGLIAGHAYRISDLFKAMLLISANDAAMSVAQATGSVSKGVAMMNAEAHHLQADDTVARRPNGLNGPGQHVSAYDEALFARRALAIPEFLAA